MTERNVMQQQAYFVYEKKEQGICILRCYAKESRVVVPEEIEGLPVTEIAPYAFAADMEKEPKNPGELPCICGELLEELVLPGTVERIGRYVFYNCRYFREFTFGANIRYMGAGAFTGCKRLSKLHVRDMGQEKSCLREVLVDLNQTVTVEWLGKDGFQVLYPAFFEEAVENTPARIIETHTHGVGIQYRNAFRNTQIDWEEYDRLFEIADVVTATGHEYSKGALFTRNRYLVTNADIILAAFDGQPGGTAMTCDLARRYDVPVIKIKPTVN